MLSIQEINNRKRYEKFRNRSLQSRFVMYCNNVFEIIGARTMRGILTYELLSIKSKVSILLPEDEFKESTKFVMQQ